MWIIKAPHGEECLLFCLFFLSNCCSMISKLLLARRGRWWLWGRQGCRFLTGDQRGRGSAGTSLWGWPHGLGLRNAPIILKPDSGRPAKTGSIHGWRASHHGSFKSGFLDFFQQPGDPYLLFLSGGGHQQHILSSSGVIADLTGGYPRLPTHKAGLVGYNMFFVKFSPTPGTF